MIERELLFGNPVKAAPKVSPDGRRLAFLAPEAGVLNVWLSESVRPDAPARPITQDRGRGIRAYFWACDGKSLIYAQDKDGDENWHLHQADIETGKTRDLTPFEGAQAHALATDPKFPHEMLVTSNARDKRVHDVLLVDLRDGSSRTVCENPGDVIGWLADGEFSVRAAKAQRPDGGSELRVRETETTPWRTAVTWGPDDQGGALGFTSDGKALYVETSLGADTTRLVTLQLSDGAETEIFHDPRVDLGGALFHPTDYRLQAVAVEPERLEWTVLDPSMKEDFAVLAKSCPGDFEVVSRDDADRLWVVFYNNDSRPPCFYLYDRETKKTEFLFSTRPQLEGLDLGAMTPVSIPARDGLTLKGYLTLPAGKKEKLPLVLLVHGGPWARDNWGWHPEALWLADRGCAVLRVNFRGSTGYGKGFLHAGDRQWGAKMQDDLTDAVRWAVGRGVADAARVAIYGGSYGGYAALAGAAFTPEIYACAVDIVGPSNLETLIRSIPPYWEPMKRIFDLRVGDIEKEPEFLRARSPLHSADKITVPLLIAQGANDPRVKQAESEQIVSVLRAKGKTVEYMLFPDEGHGFARPENRLKFYAAAETFLSRHLGSGTTHPKAP